MPRICQTAVATVRELHFVHQYPPVPGAMVGRTFLTTRPVGTGTKWIWRRLGYFCRPSVKPEILTAAHGRSLKGDARA